MLEPYKKILTILNAREKRRFLLLMVILIFAGFAEVVGLSAFLVLLGLLAEPEKALEQDTVSWVYQTLNFQSLFAFQVFAALAVAVVIFTGLLVKAAAFYATLRFVTNTAYHLSVRMLRGYLSQPYIWSLHQNASNIGRIVLTECEAFVNRVARPTLNIIASIILCLSIVGFLLLVDPVIALVSFAILGGGYGLTYLLVRRPLERHGDQIVQMNRARYKLTLEAASGLKDIKLAGLEDVYANEFVKPSERRAKSLIWSLMVTTIPRFVLEGLTFTILLVVVLLLLLRNDGDLLAAVPTLGIFGFSVMRLLPALQQVYFGFSSVRAGLATLDVVYNEYMSVEAFKKKQLENDRETALPLTHQLQFDGVSFSYPDAPKTAMHNLSTTIEANSTVGIVGGTGAGKTTFVDLLLGLLTPDEGKLIVDGTPLTDENTRSWQNTLGYVPQQIFLTDDTVVANIAFGIAEDEVDMTAVRRAAKIAALHEFVVDELPQGYDTPIGDRGVRLSGGQRQRIGIARALYHDPSILILDEATSALDNITERAVMQAVQNLQNQKTIIMIAHRLSTVEKCDTILLMEKGVIVATGTYQELAETNPIFQEMIGKETAGAA